MITRCPLQLIRRGLARITWTEMQALVDTEIFDLPVKRGRGAIDYHYQQRSCVLGDIFVCIHSYEPGGKLKLLVLDANPKRIAFGTGSGEGALDR